MLQNAPTLAIVAVDTDENEPSKVRQVTNRIRRNIGSGAGRAAAPRPQRPGGGPAPAGAVHGEVPSAAGAAGSHAGTGREDLRRDYAAPDGTVLVPGRCSCHLT